MLGTNIKIYVDYFVSWVIDHRCLLSRYRHSSVSHAVGHYWDYYPLPYVYVKPQHYQDGHPWISSAGARYSNEFQRRYHDDVIKWKHFRVTGPLCGEFTGPGEFPTQRPVTRSFDVFFDLRLNKRLSKKSWGWWFETLSRPLWRQCNVQFKITI